MSETTSSKNDQRLKEFTRLLIELAAKAENNFPSGVVFFAFLNSTLQYAARYVQPGELAQMLRNMADDLDDLDNLQRAQPPADPAKLN